MRGGGASEAVREAGCLPARDEDHGNVVQGMADFRCGKDSRQGRRLLAQLGSEGECERCGASAAGEARFLRARNALDLRGIRMQINGMPGDRRASSGPYHASTLERRNA